MTDRLLEIRLQIGKYRRDQPQDIEGNAAERPLYAVAPGQENDLFACICNLIGAAKPNGMDLEAYLREVITRLQSAEDPLKYGRCDPVSKRAWDAHLPPGQC